MNKIGIVPPASFDLNVELTKIHIFSEHVHERLASSISNIYAFFVGFLVLFFTLFYSNIISLISFIFAIIVFFSGTIYVSVHIRQRYKKNIAMISEMIEQVKEKHELSKLQDLIQHEAEY